MRLRAASRWLVASGAVAALVGMTIAPAYAEPAPTLRVYLPDTLVAAGTDGAELDPIIYGTQGAPVAHNLKIKYDYAGVASFADVTMDDPFCTATGTVISCDLRDQGFDTWGGGLIGPVATPKAGAKDGDTGLVKVTVTADNFATTAYEGRVSVADGVDLAAERLAPLSLAREATFRPTLGVQNVGSGAVHGAVLLFYGDYPIRADEKHSNCTYVDDIPRTCTFGEDLDAGQSYGLTTGFKLRADTLAPSTQALETFWMTPAEWAAQKKYLEDNGFADQIGTPGTGAAVGLVHKAPGDIDTGEGLQTDLNPYNNAAYLEINVTGTHKADVAAVGGAATGAQGSVVGVTFGVRNNGPAVAGGGRSGENIVFVDFTVPSGASAVAADPSCYPLLGGGNVDWDHPGQGGHRNYRCSGPFFLAVGDQELYAFQLRLDTVKANDKGEVKLGVWYDGGISASIDADRTNDTAYVVLNGSAASAPAEPSASPSTGGQGGGLPVTGTPVVVIAVAGLALLAIGLGVFRIARRRRLTEV